MNKFENNLSEGSVFKKLLLFALPFLISNIVQSLYNVADMLIVGNFCGPESMSGVSLGGQVTFILTNIVFGLGTGATVLIGQYLGAGQREKMQKITATVLTMLVGIGLFITVIMIGLRDPLLRLIRTPAESFSETSSYLTVTLTGIVFIFGYNALSAIMRGMGDSKRPLWFVSIACAVNIVLDFVFVAGLRMAAFGAALATVISQAVSMFLCILYMRKNDFHFDFKLTSFKLDLSELRKMLKIGFPSAIQNGVTSISFLLIQVMVNVVGGVFASAAIGAAGKFNSFAIMPVFAMSASISTMAAQSFGAGKVDRAAKACRIGMAFAAGIGILVFILTQMFAGEIIALFGDDARMIVDGEVYLRTFSFDYLIVPFMFCLNGLFIGGGHTMFSLFNSMLSSILLRVPVSYLFGVVLDWGIRGIGMGAPAASAGSLIIALIFLLSGKWKENAVQKRDAELGEIV